MPRGFVLDEAEAPGTALPNVEDPGALIETWSAWPVPFTFAPVPLESRYRADDMLGADPATGAVSARAVSYNSAHPAMRPGALRGGEEVEITGMTPGDPLRFRVPGRRLAAHVWLADRGYTFPLRLDTLSVFVEERRFFTVHRCHFTYSVVAEEVRLARLREALESPAGGEP